MVSVLFESHNLKLTKSSLILPQSKLSVNEKKKLSLQVSVEKRGYEIISWTN